MFDPYASAFDTAIGAGALPKLPGLMGRPIAQVKPAAKPGKAGDDKDAKAAEAPKSSTSAPAITTEEKPVSQALPDVPMLGLDQPGAGASSASGGATPAVKPPPAAIREAIVKAAKDSGQDPAYALAVAGRESSFDPNAKNSKSIYGLFQMSGGLRSKYGVGDSSDPETQARGFLAFTNDLRGEMAAKLGRDPSPPETYLGHYFGGTRAARMLKGDPNTPVQDLFTPNELAQNPNLARAGTAGNAIGSITRDIQRRMGGDKGAEPKADAGMSPDFAQFGQPVGQAAMATPGIDPALSPADQAATVAAQTPAMLTGGVKPNPEAFDAAVASMSASQNVEDRRDLPQPDPAATPRSARTSSATPDGSVETQAGTTLTSAAASRRSANG